MCVPLCVPLCVCVCVCVCVQVMIWTGEFSARCKPGTLSLSLPPSLSLSLMPSLSASVVCGRPHGRYHAGGRAYSAFRVCMLDRRIRRRLVDPWEAMRLSALTDKRPRDRHRDRETGQLFSVALSLSFSARAALDLSSDLRERRTDDRLLRDAKDVLAPADSVPQEDKHADAEVVRVAPLEVPAHRAAIH